MKVKIRKIAVYRSKVVTAKTPEQRSDCWNEYVAYIENRVTEITDQSRSKSKTLAEHGTKSELADANNRHARIGKKRVYNYLENETAHLKRLRIELQIPSHLWALADATPDIDAERAAITRLLSSAENRKRTAARPVRVPDYGRAGARDPKPRSDKEFIGSNKELRAAIRKARLRGWTDRTDYLWRIAKDRMVHSHNGESLWTRRDICEAFHNAL